MVQAHVPFNWRTTLHRPHLQRALPFITSLAVHAGVVLIGVLFFVGVHYVRQIAPPHVDQTVIPSAWTESQSPLTASLQSIGLDNQRRAMQDRIMQVDTPDGWAHQTGPKTRLDLGGGAGDSTDALIAPGPGGGFGKSANARGIGAGSLAGDEAGPLLPFGTPGGGGDKGAMFPKSSARRIVFVCDASGSMLQKFDVLKRELSRGVHRLDPTQSFNLIFFQEENCVRLAAAMVPATPDAKNKVDRFLDTIIPRAETNPIPALDAAFALKPELIFLLTDGDFPDNQAVLDYVARHDANRKLRINPLAFVNEKDKDTDFTAVLMEIAKRSGGTYRFLREGDF
jgi:hypothetical protein